MNRPMPKLTLGSLTLDSGLLMEGYRKGYPLTIDEEAGQRIRKSREIVEKEMRPAYGINTGLGPLKDKRIAPEDLSMLSENTLRSHACGSGNPLPQEVSKLMLLLRIHALALGYSGVRHSLIEKLIEFYEKGVLGVVYEHGSVGSSGDLVPLAHIALPLLGEGEAWDGERICPAGEVLRKKEIRTFAPAAKEGLSLINGTQFMTALSLLALERGERLVTSSNVCLKRSIGVARSRRTVTFAWIKGCASTRSFFCMAR